MSIMNADQTAANRVYRGIHVNDEADIPSEHDLSHVYIVGIPGNRWLAVMKCPCECGDVIKLNLLPSEKPLWAWDIAKWGEVTFAPSIQRTVRCKSHFFLIGGKVQWCDFPHLVPKK